MVSKGILVELSILSMIVLTLLEIVLLTNISPSMLWLVYMIAPMLTVPMVLAVVWKRSFATVIMAIGLLCMLGSMMLLPHILSIGIISKDKFYTASLRSFLLGIAMVAISMIMVYKPEMLYARNRPRDDDEDNIKVWDGSSSSSSSSSRMASSKLLIPLRKLLDDRENMLLPMYRYVLVIIDGVTYLVSPDDYVPVGSMVVRRDGMFIGVRKVL
ncbi:hypothetical protein HRbin04_00001 [archaeon HR04]|nr:hypothetical protein HRbin04_00001 [archaeon HR04]